MTAKAERAEAVFIELAEWPRCVICGGAPIEPWECEQGHMASGVHPTCTIYYWCGQQIDGVPGVYRSDANNRYVLTALRALGY